MTVGRVIFDVPLNPIPLIVLDVWSAVAVFALLTVMVSGTCASVTDPVTSANPYDGFVADLAQAKIVGSVSVYDVRYGRLLKLYPSR